MLVRFGRHTLRPARPLQPSLQNTILARARITFNTHLAVGDMYRGRPQRPGHGDPLIAIQRCLAKHGTTWRESALHSEWLSAGHRADGEDRQMPRVATSQSPGRSKRKPLLHAKHFAMAHQHLLLAGKRRASRSTRYTDRCWPPVQPIATVR